MDQAHNSIFTMTLLSMYYKYSWYGLLSYSYPVQNKKENLDLNMMMKKKSMQLEESNLKLNKNPKAVVVIAIFREVEPFAA